MDTCLADTVLCISNTELVFSQQVSSERVFEMMFRAYWDFSSLFIILF